MSEFDKYVESIIEDFVEDCKCCKSIDEDQELTKDQLSLIKENFKEHKSCYDRGYEEAKEESTELILSCIYGENESASIECMECNSIIIDDTSLFGEED